MSDSTDTAPIDYDAEDAALREHRREANKMTRWFIVAAVPFAVMFAVLLFAFYWSTRHASSPTAQAPVTAAQPAVATVSDKDAEIARLRNQILTLQAQAGQPVMPGAPVYSADPAALAQLSARVDRIEANQRALARAAAAANAATALQVAARGDAPFVSQLSVVEASVDDPAAIALLRPFAEKGVPSEVSLAIEFPTIAARANLAAKDSSGKESLLDRILHAIGISVRHTGNIDGEGAQANLQRAETRLNVGDLRGAVNYLTKLSPAAQTAIKPWLDRAQDRLSVDDATQRLTEGALARLSQSSDYTAQPAAGGVQ